MYTMRFDLRGSNGTAATSLYPAALDMAAWGEQNGCLAVVVSEHHCSEDGYLPSPVVMASAMAGRTSSVAIVIAAAILPFYDPIRLAEDLIVLDLVSGGRVAVVLGLGYRPEEFDLYGVPMSDRGRLAEERLALLLAALREGEVKSGDRRGAVWPRPRSTAGPNIAYGGSTPVAARRAARHGLDFVAQTADDSLRAVYLAEVERVGGTPGNVTVPSPRTPLALFVADDVDRAWDELGPYLLHDATTYASWNEGDQMTVSLDRATTVEELRAAGGSHRIVTVDEARALQAQDGYLSLHPLCGGIPPELAWEYLRRAAQVASGG